jgi:hypothetical protein
MLACRRELDQVWLILFDVWPEDTMPGVRDLRGQPYIATTALPWAIERAFRRG